MPSREFLTHLFDCYWDELHESIFSESPRIVSRFWQVRHTTSSGWFDRLRRRPAIFIFIYSNALLWRRVYSWYPRCGNLPRAWKMSPETTDDAMSDSAHTQSASMQRSTFDRHLSAKMISERHIAEKVREKIYETCITAVFLAIFCQCWY